MKFVTQKSCGSALVRRMSSITLAFVGALLLLPAGESVAMPNLARQYGVECGYCHTVIPRLNRDGYAFRSAGFRNPDEIGETRDIDNKRGDSSFNMADYFSARLQMNASFSSVDDGSGSNTNSGKIEFKEFTLYPLTGAFLGNWAAESEISGGTDEIEVENGYLRYVTGDEKTYYQVRGGIFHPFEGFGASDRPLGLSRAYIQSKGTVNALGDKNGWHPWGFDQAGIEAGFTHGNTSLAVAVLNGIIENADDPAQGGKLRKDAASPTYNDVDFQIFGNQFIGDSDAAIGLYYYNGRISLGDATLVQNDFQRYAAYFTIPYNTFNLIGAYSGGVDKDATTDKSINNQGWFAEVDNYFSETLGAGLRYDWFDPSDDASDDRMTAVSAFVNMPLNTGVQFIAEYKYAQTETGPGTDVKTNSVNLRAIYIF